VDCYPWGDVSLWGCATAATAAAATAAAATAATTASYHSNISNCISNISNSDKHLCPSCLLRLKAFPTMESSDAQPMVPSEGSFWDHVEDDPFYFGIPVRLDEDGRAIPDHDGSGSEIEEDFITK
jgi:hypothetical protein